AAEGKNEGDECEDLPHSAPSGNRPPNQSPPRPDECQQHEFGLRLRSRSDDMGPADRHHEYLPVHRAVSPAPLVSQFRRRRRLAVAPSLPRLTGAMCATARSAMRLNPSAIPYQDSSWVKFRQVRQQAECGASPRFLDAFLTDVESARRCAAPGVADEF